MSEEQEPYKKILNTDQMLQILSNYCREKLKENLHKPDPMCQTIDSLIEHFDSEVKEFKKAIRIWQTNRTGRNLREIEREMADIVNIGGFIVFKAKGFELFERG